MQMLERGRKRLRRIQNPEKGVRIEQIVHFSAGSEAAGIRGASSIHPQPHSTNSSSVIGSNASSSQRIFPSKPPNRRKGTFGVSRFVDGHNLRDRLVAAHDHNLLARFCFFQQPREVSFRLVDGVGHGLSMLSPPSEVNLRNLGAKEPSAPCGGQEFACRSLHALTSGAVIRFGMTAVVDSPAGQHSPTRRGQNYDPGYCSVC